MEIIKNCKNCANAIFDERWGEYKCKKYKHRIRNVDRYVDCINHKAKEKKEK